MSDSGHDHTHGGHGEATYPYTPHHFHTAKQHFESGKMGVWLFLVTEILFFAGLFCAYTIYRAQHPEVFYWAHFYLDTTWGAANTVVLILSSFTAAWAVRNAQLGQVGKLKMNILLTIAGACFFMCVKYVEYSHKFHDGLLPSRHFDPSEEVWETPSFKKKHPESAAAAVRIVEGLARRSEAQASITDEVLRRDAAPKLTLIPVANPATDEGVQPEAREARGDAGATDSKAESATGEATAKATADGSETDDSANADSANADSGNADKAASAEKAAEDAASSHAALAEADLSDDAWLNRQIRALSKDERRPLEMAGVIRKPADGPLEFARPAKAGVFFSIYFFMTGLHGLHVLIGIGLWIWMLVIATKRKMGDRYFGPIDFTALYWHLVDLIWIYLFPMLYLIH